MSSRLIRLIASCLLGSPRS